MKNALDTGAIKRIDSGDPKVEICCASFKVYVVCKDSFGLDEVNNILHLGSNSKVEDIQVLLESIIGQPLPHEIISDTDGYEISPGDSLHLHSKLCTVSLVFKRRSLAEHVRVRRTKTQPFRPSLLIRVPEMMGPLSLL